MKTGLVYVCCCENYSRKELFLYDIETTLAAKGREHVYQKKLGVHWVQMVLSFIR